MSTIRTNAILDAAGGNTATVNGVTVALASLAEAQAGTDNTKLMTPLRVSDAIASDIASQVQAEAGTDNATLMTPLRAAQAISALSTVLLGTITTTSGTSQTLSGLTLTPYKFLICSFNGVSLTSTGDITITSNAAGRLVASLSTSTTTINGLVTIDLATGGFTAVTSDSVSTGSRIATSGASGLTTASTSVTFLGASFDAGSILVYGVR